MRLLSRSTIHVLALLATVVFVSLLASAQGGSTGVPPRPEAGLGRPSPMVSSSHTGHATPPRRAP